MPHRDPALLCLPLSLFLWVAGSDGVVSPREVEVFRRMLQRTSWTRSALGRSVLPAVEARYGELWKELSGADGEGLREHLIAGFQRAVEHYGPGEAEVAREDLLKLAHAVARASGGVGRLGAVAPEEKEALERLEGLLSTGGSPDGEGDDTPSRGEPLHADPVWTSGRIRVRCVRIVEETHDVRTLAFAPLSRMRFSYKPGQFLTLELELDGEKVLRSYTIASTPSRPDLLEVTVKRVPGGRVSNWLHDQVSVGDEFQVTGPAGKFSYLFHPCERFLLISGGSGVTPVMSMARHLHDTGDHRDVVFLHSARREEDLVFRKELELLEARHPSFRAVFTLTQDAPEGWTGVTGRVTPELVREAVPDFMERTVFLCGPNPFMEAVKEAFEALDFPMENFHWESFGGAPRKAARPAPLGRMGSLLPTPQPRSPAHALPEGFQAPAASSAPGGGSAPALLFTESNQETEPGEGTVLDAADEIGVYIPNACRSGVCGTCKVRIREGEVEMSCEDGLSPEEKEEGWVLACVARALGPLQVEA